MINVYKLGGNRKRKGIGFTLKTINNDDASEYLSEGWVLSFDELEVSESGSDYEAELRLKIKALGGTPGGRSKIETLEKQLDDLKAKQEAK